jgi:hypothetical protein
MFLSFDWDFATQQAVGGTGLVVAPCITPYASLRKIKALWRTGEVISFSLNGVFARLSSNPKGYCYWFDTPVELPRLPIHYNLFAEKHDTGGVYSETCIIGY